MSKFRYYIPNLPTGLLFALVISFLFFLIMCRLTPGSNLLYAADFSSKNYQLTFENSVLSISADKADLKNILSDIAKSKDISIRYPASLDKKITLKINEVSLKEALERLLKDFNYSIIYSGSKKHAVISDVYIVDPDTKSSRQNISNARMTDRIRSRITNSIRSYERRIESLEKSLSKVGENSTRGRSYSNRIKSYKRTIERLKSQLN